MHHDRYYTYMDILLECKDKENLSQGHGEDRES